jgi:hypothetical protein
MSVAFISIQSIDSMKPINSNVGRVRFNPPFRVRWRVKANPPYAD